MQHHYRTAAPFEPGAYFGIAELKRLQLVNSRSAVRRAIRRGDLPPPSRLPGNRIAWRGHVLNAYLAALDSGCAARDAALKAVEG